MATSEIFPWGWCWDYRRERVCISPRRSPLWGGAGDAALCINVTKDKVWKRGMDAQL